LHFYGQALSEVDATSFPCELICSLRVSLSGAPVGERKLNLQTMSSIHSVTKVKRTPQKEQAKNGNFGSKRVRPGAFNMGDVA
jgi:hypothetical protein